MTPSIEFFPRSAGSESSKSSSARPLTYGWLPYLPRHDKAEPNALATVRHAEVASRSHLVANASALRSVMAPRLDNAFCARSSSTVHHGGVHPALTKPFCEVNELISAAVDDGRVEQQAIAGTDLMIYNSRLASSHQSDLVIQICRGLVLSPVAIVAAPFYRFYHHNPGGGQIGENELVEATEKKDGSLIIAFTYHGELITCTKRRADTALTLSRRSGRAPGCKSAAYRPSFCRVSPTCLRQRTGTMLWSSATRTTSACFLQSATLTGLNSTVLLWFSKLPVCSSPLFL